MEYTIAALRAALGGDVRFALRRRPGDVETAELGVGVRWECGCEAHGPDWVNLAVEPCRVHATLLPLFDFPRDA